jgi:hypothetical protein
MKSQASSQLISARHLLAISRFWLNGLGWARQASPDGFWLAAFLRLHQPNI